MMTTKIRFQHAKSSDFSTIVALLADDPLGSKRERFESWCNSQRTKGARTRSDFMKAWTSTLHMSV